MELSDNVMTWLQGMGRTVDSNEQRRGEQDEIQDCDPRSHAFGRGIFLNGAVRQRDDMAPGDGQNCRLERTATRRTGRDSRLRSTFPCLRSRYLPEWSCPTT